MFNPQIGRQQKSFLLLNETWNLLIDALQGKGIATQYLEMEATSQIVAHALAMVLLEQYNVLKREPLIRRYTPISARSEIDHLCKVASRALIRQQRKGGGVSSSTIEDLDTIGVRLLESMVLLEEDYIAKGEFKVITFVTRDNQEFPVSLSDTWAFPGVDGKRWFSFLERLNQVALEVKDRMPGG